MIFFFQAEDGIRDDLVTGVQTCALPISKAATFLDYQRRVWDAASAVERLRITSHGEDRKQLDQRVESTIARVRADLPAKETVPMGGASVVVDNTWLHEALDDYLKMKGDDARRGELLAHIDER